LFASFSEAFNDYEVQITKDEFQVMLLRRGFVPELSFGAFDQDRLVSFTLNGIGTFNGVKTAYDTGTGTIKEYRQKGLATRIFEYSIPILKNAGVSQYLLEVLQHNHKAVSVYQKLGFKVCREFNYFRQGLEEINTDLKTGQEKFDFSQITLNNREQMRSFWDFTPSWQNSFDSISRCSSDFIKVGAIEGLNMVGYCIFEPNTGDITQIAVDRKYRRQGIGTGLLAEVMKHIKCKSIKLINAEIGHDSIRHFVESKGILLKGKQYEMLKPL
jgi:ribosomal protein S18 acetylase RimI-like enzyme